MPLVNFTNLDFDQIKVSIKDYLRANSNFTDYDFEGSNLSTVIDVLAYNTYISSYNANMVSNEVFIDSATLRENVVALARNIGYLPTSRKCSTAKISFLVNTTNFSTSPVSLTIKKGLFANSSSTFGSESYSFTIPDDITVPVVNGIAVFNNIDIYEGSFLTNNFTFNENDAKQRFILPNSDIDTSTISVVVRDTQSSTSSVKYNVNDSLIDVTSISKVFFIQEIEDQRYELIFGDGVFGQKLEDLNFIEVSYTKTNGPDGNGVSSFTYAGRIVDNNNNLVSSGISLLTANVSSLGGKDIESVDSIKNYAPRIYASQNRAVTAADYEALIPKIYPETQSVSVFGGEELNPPQYGKVFITIKPFYGPYVPTSIKQNLKNILRKYSVAGIVPHIQDLKYLYVELHTTAYYNPNLANSANAVKTIISENVNTYANSSQLNKYGAKFKYSKFQNIIDSSHDAVTSNITTVHIRRDLRARLNQTAEYELCFGNPFYVKNQYGYNIKSSGFRVSGIAETLYFADLPGNIMYGTSSRYGRLVLFKLDENNQAAVVRDYAGSVDYIKGEIMVNPINIIGTDTSIQGEPIIEVSTCPISNDVIGLQDLYLQLDISNSRLNMLEDNIASGANPSGTLYTTTSSYSSGSIVRRNDPSLNLNRYILGSPNITQSGTVSSTSSSY